MIKNYCRNIFLIVFVSELVGGIYLGFFKGILLNDAFSRTANVFYVLYVKPARLASLGFVWNPLPSMLQLPFVELSKLWRPIVSCGISSTIVTSSSAALSAVILFQVFNKFDIPKKYSISIISLYVSNPFIFFYGMNGMSEETFFLFAIYAVANMTLWIKEGTPEYIIKIAFALTFAFFCRYEAVPFAAAIGFAVLINIFFNKNEKKFIPINVKWEKYHYAEGTAIVLYAPMIYGILLWIFLNWTITGNPLYFLNSTYSNMAQSQLTKPVGSLFNIAEYVAIRSVPFLFLFFGIVIVRLSTRRLLKSDFFMLCALVSAMVIFHFLMLVKGRSYGWLRFFSYAFPICIAWVPYEISEIRKEFRPVIFKILCVSLLISSIFTARSLLNPVIAVEENYAVITAESIRVSDYINEQLCDNKLMMDSFVTSAIILNVKNVDNLVVSSSLNFDKYLSNPGRYGIEYIVVPDPSNGVGALDAFNRMYPGLYKYGADWCILYKEFDGYKIFKIIY